ITNLAHGGMYLVGGYIGLSVAQHSGNFFLGVGASGVAIGLMGLLIQRGLLGFVQGDLSQVLLTLGIALVLGDMSLVVWGGYPQTIPVPEQLQQSVTIGPLTYPVYRLFVLALGVAVFLLLLYLLYRTRLGALIRAGVDDLEMVDALGINIKKVFTLVFLLGATLAGLSGVLGGAFLSLYPGADNDILTLSLVVVVIGGIGSLVGTMVGSVLVAFLSTFGQVYAPALAYFLIFGPMLIVLPLRPQGLFGRKVA
ncbi:MAG TPA: branched-chain amino acid ABC transporter permease, partial [Chloroflexota bacterium]|nr:branched-chain amino acid ABC transporter permease [Chloroflexota bacterium]